MDSVQAHKLFPAIPFLVTMSYCQEMARVVQSNDWIVFDIITESCLTPQYLQAWFEADIFDWSWSPRLVGSFLVPLYPGVTECLIFRKSP
jgi:hypothetical protein